MIKTAFLIIGLTITLALFPSELKVTNKKGKYQVAIIDKNNNSLLQNSKNGLWAIAINWENQWMTNWYYGSPDTIENVNGYTILSGKIILPEGDMLIRDAYLNENGIIKCTRRFNWLGKKPLKKATLAIEFLAKGKGNKLFMPGIMYYGNPSGAKSNHTPIYEGKVGDLILFEEHRFPMPLVSLEWESKTINGAALHSQPSPVPYANLHDQWWSMGAQTSNEGTLLSLYSGACAANGQKSVIKTHQGKNRNMFTAYDNAYLNIPPNGIIEKTFYLEVYKVEETGSGFQQPIYTSMKIFNPSLDNLPNFDAIVRSKYNFAIQRWIEGDNYAGFNQFSNDLVKKKNYIVLGWVGQAAAPGYAFQFLQNEINDPKSLELAQRSLDFISTATLFDQGINTWYHTNKGEWGQRIWKKNPELLSQGQCMFNIANAIKASEKSGLNSEKWKSFLINTSNFHAKRILDKNWNPKSTDEGFFIAPLCMAAAIFNNKTYKEAAIKAGEHYAKRNLKMEEIYWGGTLDASCEDKEGAFAAFQGFLALYELTLDKKYLIWAKHACDITISYTFVWDVDLPAGRLRDHNFKTRGWTAVSVQNMHIDVFGVLIAPFVYKLGNYLDNNELKNISKLMFLSCGQLIDPFGSQGEQPQQTNYTQDGGAPDDYYTYRGNYVEDWTVFWITAHFLNGAAMFKEMNVEF